MNTGVVCTLEGGVRPIGAKYEGNEADSQKFSMMNCGAVVRIVSIHEDTTFNFSGPSKLRFLKNGRDFIYPQ